MSDLPAPKGTPTAVVAIVDGATWAWDSDQAVPYLGLTSGGHTTWYVLTPRAFIRLLHTGMAQARQQAATLMPRLGYDPLDRPSDADASITTKGDTSDG